jgi:hypothetical protein
MIGTGAGLVALGSWFLSAGADGTFLGAFCLLAAAMTIPMAVANASIRRRLEGDPKPFVAQPVFRFAWAIWGAAAAGFLGLAVWSHGAGQAAGLQLIFFVMAGWLWVLVAVFVVFRVLLARRRRRANKGSDSDDF